VSDAATSVTDSVALLLTEIEAGDGQTLPQAGRLLMVGPATAWRFVRHGCRARDGSLVKLEAIRAGSRYLTSRAAVRRFVQRLSAEQPAPPLPPSTTATCRSPARGSWSRSSPRSSARCSMRPTSRPRSSFRGNVVNKRLTVNTGVDEFPRFVVEYLIDNYCTEDNFQDDLRQVIRRLREYFVHGAEAERSRFGPNSAAGVSPNSSRAGRIDRRTSATPVEGGHPGAGSTARRGPGTRTGLR
jgi:hypothetical protein